MLSEDGAKAVCSAHHTHLEDVLGHVATHVPTTLMLQYQWCRMVWPTSADTVHNPSMGVEPNMLQQVSLASITVPDDFVHATLLPSFFFFLLLTYPYPSRRSIRTCNNM